VQEEQEGGSSHVTKFLDADSGEGCTVQEALFHFFGLSIKVIAQPAAMNRTSPRTSPLPPYPTVTSIIA